MGRTELYEGCVSGRMVRGEMGEDAVHAKEGRVRGRKEERGEDAVGHAEEGSRRGKTRRGVQVALVEFADGAWGEKEVGYGS